MSDFEGTFLDFVSDCSDDRSFICRLYGYVERDVPSKMRKLSLARKLQDLQIILRYAYERGSFSDKR